MTLSLVPPIWKEAPFIRLLIPFAGGILLEQSTGLQPFIIVLLIAALSLGFGLYQLSSLFLKFKLGWMTGIFIQLLLLCAGCLVYSGQDETKEKNSLVNQYDSSDLIQLTLEEPLVEKPRSYKAIASVDQLLRNGSSIPARGKVIIYFAKDKINSNLGYGSSIIVSRPLELINNSGNPGSFDYKLYCQRQGIYYTVFLSASNYSLLPGENKQLLKDFLFASKEKILNILSLYIPGEKESGFAKALLIGYKDDLDKNLVQAYSNTGVVHVIAISGLHLGIIFWLLSLIARPFQEKFNSKWLTAILIILGLWFFSLLAGAGPSVLRSAFMFSIIVLGKSLSRHSNIYNNLSFSAFVLLCINPNWLWDAGFQLSYAAVLSIVIFFRPIYNWLYFENKIVDFIWKLSAVTLSAQVLTLPISVYHFHQLPVHFLLSNLVAVPLSSLILIGEILLCCFSFFPALATITGTFLGWMIQFLNDYIEKVDQLPFAVWDQLQISFPQMMLMFIIIAGCAAWLMQKQKKGLLIGLYGMLTFAMIRYQSFYNSSKQLKLIVYNIQNVQALDFINGREYYAAGDSSILNNAFIQNFNLKPSRTLHRVRATRELEGLLRSGNLFNLGNKIVLMVDQHLPLPVKNIPVDILVLSKNPRIHISSLIKNFSPGIVIADGSNAIRKSASWKKACDSLDIRFHNVATEGAYVLNLR